MPVSTTHVGSLPRSQKVVDFIFAREKDEPYDPAAFDAAMTEAVSDTVRKQAEAGIEIPFPQRDLHLRQPSVEKLEKLAAK